jgi:LCP family protein required for cell wall assembly
VRVNFVNPSAALLSIPRDLYVPLPNLSAFGIEQSRINTAYVYGEAYDVPGGGPAEFKQTIELNFGLRVDRYALVNFGAFVQGVDAIGGIDVSVPVAIYDDHFPTDDDTGTEVFEVPAGLVHMDGATALRYVRTRHQDDDYHRLGRQQDVLLALRDRLTQPEVLPQVPALIAALAAAGRTDLSPAEITALLCLAPQIDRSAIQSLPIGADLVLPWVTSGGAWVSIPNRDLIAPVVQQFLDVGNAVAQNGEEGGQ